MNKYVILKMISSHGLCLSKETVYGFPETCHEVRHSGGQEGYHTLDPEQDGLDPMPVFCNMSSTPVTAVVHHNRENWTYVSGYADPGSYDGQVGSVFGYALLPVNHILYNSADFGFKNMSILTSWSPNDWSIHEDYFVQKQWLALIFG